MARVTKLPNEILLDVFQRLSNSDLVSATLCCQRLYRLASVILYAHASVESRLRRDSPAAQFARNVTQRNLVRSLDLRITQVHLMGLSIQSVEAFDRITELSLALPQMENLKSFSLSFEQSPSSGFTIPSIPLVWILKSLPESVIHLNLGFEELDNPDPAHSHVCHAISALVPRLRSLRLRVSHLCSGLLARISPQATFDNERQTSVKSTSHTSQLESILIRIDRHPGLESEANAQLCFSGGKQLQGAKIAEMLTTLYDIGAFPNLRRFAVVGRVDAQVSPMNDHWDVFKMHDWSRDGIRTTTFPWCARGGSSTLFMIRDDDGDWFGSYDDIANSLEGSLLWTNSGLQPRSQRQETGNRVSKLKHEELMTRQSVVQKFGVSLRLWKHEDVTGMSLLRVRSTKGFDDMAASSQHVPVGWRWVPEGPWNWTIQPIAAG